MALHTTKKGLDLPLTGEPVPTIGPAAPVSHVALLGADYPGLKPALRVQPGDPVQRGQALFEDRRRPGVLFTAPAAGTVAAVHRGDRRVFLSLVIAVAAAESQVTFASYRGRAPEQLDAAEVRALLLESGLWTALRTRPFGKLPAPQESCDALFVTAIDTRPHAPSPSLALADRAADLRAGLVCLTRLTAGPVFFCTDAAMAIEAPPGVVVERFAGPHPAGNVGLHIHRLHPVGLENRVWHIGCQDVAAIGRLFLTGTLDVERVISLAGPGVLRPRLLRTRIGAATGELVRSELQPGEQRVLSGSVLDGRAASGPAEGYLGRYHLQVAALPEGRRRELLGWLRPGADKYSVTGVVLGAFARARRFALTTSTNGGPRAMVPIGSYERVMPFDILPTFLLRALIVGDDVRAQQLGCLELDEEDVALCTYVCPGKYEYGPLLRSALERIEKEA